MDKFRSIVITGASSGIGAALALAYAASNVALALTGRNFGRLEDVAAACRARGASVIAKVIDVTDRDAMSTWLKEVDANSPVDLVIANAGVSPDIDNAKLADLNTAHDTMSVNFGGVLNTVLPLLPKLRARERGQVVVMASLAGFWGLPYAATYNASKAAIRVWGESLRHELAHQNIGVTVVCPGFVVSRITDRWPYATPFIMPTDRAARLIRDGVECNRPRLVFPTILGAAIWFLGLLPARISEHLIRRFA